MVGGEMASPLHNGGRVHGIQQQSRGCTLYRKTDTASGIMIIRHSARDESCSDRDVRPSLVAAIKPKVLNHGRFLEVMAGLIGWLEQQGQAP